MSEAVQVIEREIAKRQAEIAALQMALDALTGRAPAAPRSKQLALPPPQKPARRRSPEGEGGTFTVNGVDLKLTAREFAVANAINDAEDCLPAEQLEPLCGGKRNLVQQCVCALNKKLRPAGAHIEHFKGEGYRLQNIEEET